MFGPYCEARTECSPEQGAASGGGVALQHGKGTQPTEDSLLGLPGRAARLASELLQLRSGGAHLRLIPKALGVDQQIGIKRRPDQS